MIAKPYRPATAGPETVPLSRIIHEAVVEAYVATRLHALGGSSTIERLASFYRVQDVRRQGARDLSPAHRIFNLGSNLLAFQGLIGCCWLPQDPAETYYLVPGKISQISLLSDEDQREAERMLGLQRLRWRCTAPARQLAVQGGAAEAGGRS